ncbi:hypothetical protein DDZ13_14645 [Coraliomargarita sinensis]|uniref:Uncharacterized protein n=1 Tax=Coraliomargarita sinensis TaxID=2174842 RepID=A0A317ZG79_9BACT|nr:hypothetical protein [Coraliomargarita sinensis]PXA02938.1 hypothetical protein DDZ13_14645 [Coraliomargarita sinensis]
MAESGKLDLENLEADALESLLDDLIKKSWKHRCEGVARRSSSFKMPFSVKEKILNIMARLRNFLVLLVGFLGFLSSSASNLGSVSLEDEYLTKYLKHEPSRYVLSLACRYKKIDDALPKPEEAWFVLKYVGSLHVVGEYKESVRILSRFTSEQKELLASHPRIKDVAYTLLAHAYANSGLDDLAYQSLDEVRFEKPSLGDVLSMAMVYRDLDRMDIVRNLVGRISFDDVFNNIKEYDDSDVPTYVALLIYVGDVDLASKLFNRFSNIEGYQEDDFDKYLRLKIALSTSRDAEQVKQLFEEFEDDVHFLPIIRAED